MVLHSISAAENKPWACHSYEFWPPPSAALVKRVFVSHRGALHPRSLLQAAEQGAADSGGMRQQAGSARAFWKGRRSNPLTHLCSRESAVSCLSGGFCSIIGMHFIILFFFVLSALAAEPALNFFLNLHLCQSFVLFAVHFFKNASIFKYPSLSSPTPNADAMKRLLRLCHCICHRCYWGPSGQRRFSLIIWSTSGRKAERRRRRTFILEGGRP